MEGSRGGGEGGRGVHTEKKGYVSCLVFDSSKAIERRASATEVGIGGGETANIVTSTVRRETERNTAQTKKQQSTKTGACVSFDEQSTQT